MVRTRQRDAVDSRVCRRSRRRQIGPRSHDRQHPATGTDGAAVGVREREAVADAGDLGTDEGLDEKIVLRSDGTAVYITQDIGTTIRKVVQYCFSFDPEQKTYVFNLLRVAATVTILTAAVFMTFLIITGRKRRRR